MAPAGIEEINALTRLITICWIMSKNIRGLGACMDNLLSRLFIEGKAFFNDQHTLFPTTPHGSYDVHHHHRLHVSCTVSAVSQRSGSHTRTVRRLEIDKKNLHWVSRRPDST